MISFNMAKLTWLLLTSIYPPFNSTLHVTGKVTVKMANETDADWGFVINNIAFFLRLLTQ